MKKYIFPRISIDVNQYVGEIKSLKQLKMIADNSSMELLEFIKKIKQSDRVENLFTFSNDGISLQDYLLSRLEIIDDKLEVEHDRIKSKYLDNNKDIEEFQKNWDLFEEASEPIQKQFSKLAYDKKLIEDIVWSSIPDYGDQMTMEEFIENVKCGGFIDYDGFGNYASKDKCSNKYISPSHIKSKKVLENKEFTHVVWYNR